MVKHTDLESSQLISDRFKVTGHRVPGINTSPEQNPYLQLLVGYCSLGKPLIKHSFHQKPSVFVPWKQHVLVGGFNPSEKY